MDDKYHIVATYRQTGVRMPITGQMTKAEAQAFRPSSADKKDFKYFKIAKYKTVKK